MLVPMVNVWEVRMAVYHRWVPMMVRMSISWRVVRAMFVLMVLVMPVSVTVFQFRMEVFVLVPLGQMEPDACGHHESCNH
jgi:hypothetical protein